MNHKTIPNGLYTNQPTIDFAKLDHIENKTSNQEHFEANKQHFSHQCRLVYHALLQGEELTTTSALILYRIGDLRRRIKDLKDKWNVPIESRYIDGRYKVFYLKNAYETSRL